MGVLEKISEALHNNEAKTVELRKRFLKLIVEWGCFEKDLQLSTKCLQECFNEMESKQLRFGSFQESVSDSLKELDAIRTSIEQKRLEVERKEKVLRSEWKALRSAREGFAETVKLREEKLNDQEKMVERQWEEVEFERKHIGDVEEKFVQISMKEKELNRIQSWIQQETNTIELKERELAKKMEEFQVKEHNLLSMMKELEIKERGLESVKKDLTIRESELDNVKKELKVNVNNLGYLKEELSEKKNNLESVEKDLALKEMKLDSLKNEARVKESKLELLKKELREKENDLEFLKKVLCTKENRLDTAKKDLRVKENDLDCVKKELREKGKNLESLKKELGVKEHRLDSVKDELWGKETNLESLMKELGVKEHRLDSVKNELQGKETNLESLKKELGVMEHRLNSVKKELREKETNLESLKKELGVKEHRLDSVKSELQEKETNLEYAKKELTEKETNLNSVRKELKEKETNLDSLRKELKEEEKNLNYVKKELREKEVNLDSVKKELAVKVARLDSTSEELRFKESNLDFMMKELEEKEINLDLVKKELREKENDLESMKKEFKAEADNLKTLRKQLESKEDFLSSMKKELEHKEKFQDTMKKKLELQEEHLKSAYERLHLRDRELNSTQEAYKQQFEELNLKEKKLYSVEEAMKKNYDAKLVELESREKYFEDRSKELAEKEKELNATLYASLKTEPTEDLAAEKVSAIAGNFVGTRFVVIMDGKSLQIFLNEHEKELNFMSDDVFKALQMSSDPAQLVLDAMEGFYPPHLTKGEIQFQGSVVRRSCILLLEQLIRVSPNISHFVTSGAIKLAREWKVKMKETKGNQDEVLGFLYLLAAYNLVSTFDEDELMILLETVSKHDKFADLCRSLCMKQKITCFIQNLLKKQQHLVALGYAYAFGFMDRFPPTPILKEYLGCVERSYVDVCEKEACSIKDKIYAIEERVTSIRAAIKCIGDCKLQSQYPVESLEESIELLTRLKEDHTVSSTEAKNPEQANVKQMESICSSTSTGTNAVGSAASFSTRAPSCTLSRPSALTIIFMNMSGRNLQTFLNKHLKEHKLLRSEVSGALRMSPDPGMLVLEALEGFYPTDYKKERIGFDRSIIRQSCILLLEELMKLQPVIKPEAKLEASKLAFAWKAKMMSEIENQSAILGFLLLLGAYRLSSAFDKDELDSLYHKVAQHGVTAEICHVLGIKDNTSKGDGFPPLEESRRHKAQVSTDEFICKGMDMKCEGRDISCDCALSIHCTSDPALLVLDALRSCDPTNLGRSEDFPSVMRSCSDLLDQLKEDVKVEAAVFANHWYSRSIRLRQDPTEVLAFLQFVATYKLGASFDSDVLFDLLEKVDQTERVTLFKMLGLTDKIRGFIQNLVNKKQWLVAFTYVYEFELVNVVSPVLLLKDYVRHSEQIAQQILNAAGNNSHQAQIKAIDCKIIALKNTVRHIVDRGLQSEYSPSHLQEQIGRLEYQKSNLTQPRQNLHFTAQQVKTNKGTCRSAPNSQVRKEFSKKRCAPAGHSDITHNAQGKHNFKRRRYLSMRR